MVVDYGIVCNEGGPLSGADSIKLFKKIQENIDAKTIPLPYSSD
jgi:hypothetical protein